MSPPSVPEPAEMGWRLSALEKQFVEHRRHMDERFDRLDSNIGSLAYVRLDLYRSEHTAQDAAIAANRTLTMWTLGLLITSVVGAIVAGLIRLAVA